jgi:hypothetical protein
MADVEGEVRKRERGEAGRCRNPENKRWTLSVFGKGI